MLDSQEDADRASLVRRLSGVRPTYSGQYEGAYAQVLEVTSRACATLVNPHLSPVT